MPVIGSLDLNTNLVVNVHMGSGSGTTTDPFISDVGMCTGVVGQAVPANGIFLCASNGTNLVPLLTDIYGNLMVTTSGVTAVPNTQTIAVTTSASYSSGDVVGGIIPLPTVNLSAGRPVSLSSLQINDASGSNVPFHIYLFKTSPTGGTYNDNSPLAWAAGDNAKIVQAIDCKAADYLTDAGQSTAGYSGLNMDCGVAATTLYIVLVAQASSAGIANGNLTLVATFNQR